MGQRLGSAQQQGMQQRPSAQLTMHLILSSSSSLGLGPRLLLCLLVKLPTSSTGNSSSSSRRASQRERGFMGMSQSCRHPQHQRLCPSTKRPLWT
jgi:hypothetical protein